ncbi:GPR1/FUN34/yaaH family-domain-containing protein [Ilyonectria sp. MPI-CAGE-AT-0026]|nr:GPR1/FUN34/yaaH family-domain-containing protein [Ilyonectria sp. MPI-CAGE-AT-0026]
MSRQSSDNSKIHNEHRDEMLHKIQTAGSIALSPELFEQLYLAPQNQVKGQLRQTLGNPTPLALGGFLLCTTPISMALLEWQGAGGFGAGANVGSYFYLGGLMLVLGGLGEWLLGNTFPATVFCLFGGFWLTFGATIVPGYGAYGLYSTTGSAADGLSEQQFYATFSFFLVSMTILCAIFMVASIRTNVVLFTIFLLLIPTFGCLSASFFAVSHDLASSAKTFQHVGAGLLLAVSFLGWYIFLALVLLSVDFPYILPLGDLSTVIPGRTDRTRESCDKA